MVLLRGEAPPPIPFLVDSTTRRRLAAEPGDAVLMAHAPESGWTQLAYADPQVRRMAEEILAAAPIRALAAEGPSALAAEAAKQLTWAQDWSQTRTFADLLASGSLADPAAEFVISVYLEAAQEAAGPIDPAPHWRLE